MYTDRIDDLVSDSVEGGGHMTQVVQAYRAAAVELYGLTVAQAERAIIAPEDDPGEWAPRGLAVIRLEFGDPLNDFIGYYARRGGDECCRLASKAGTGYIEWVNGGVAAVYP